MKHTPLSFEELKSLRKPLRNVNAERREKLTILDNFALLVTRRIGTMGFFLIIFCWTVSWLVWNMLGPDELRFDPYPAFVLWIFISNMIQIFLMPLIMVGQNLQARHAEAKAQVDFEINSKAEREIEAILQHLENQNNFLVTIIDRLERGK
ncbi:MAG: DUF1003 domain-containing protein [Patescibacteria group bacterium]